LVFSLPTPQGTNSRGAPEAKKRGFSRKERVQLEEYGSLGHQQEEEEHHSVVGSIQGKFTTVIDETVEESKRLRKHKKFKKFQGKNFPSHLDFPL